MRAALALTALAGLLVALPAAGVELERRLLVMGTEARVAVEAATRDTAVGASEAAVAALEAAEARLSTWGSGSELDRVNQAAACTAVELSPRLAAELEAALACRRATDGAFDPVIGSLVAAWGVRSGGRRPSAAELRRAREASRADHLHVEAGEAVRHHPDLMVEEGGFGKGAGLAAARSALATAGIERASIDLGGQLLLVGDGTWSVPVAHPAMRHRPAVVLELDGGSLATSGNSERGIEVDGEPRSHILDPRSGEPAEDFGSLTVWTEDPFRADCLSTGLYVLGPEKALTWAAARPGVELLVLEPAGDGLRARATPGLAGRVEATAEGVVLEEVTIDGSAPEVLSQNEARTAVIRKPRASTAVPQKPRAAARPRKDF